MKSAQATSSVIAKLMGLDESLPQLPVQKQRRVLSQNYLHRVASIGLREKHHTYGLKIDRKQLKDAIEVIDRLNEDTTDSQSVENGKTNSGLSEVMLEFTRQNEFQVSPETMDFEDDHLPKCFPSGNSLLDKYLHDLQVSPSNSQFGHTTVVNSTCASGRKLGRKHELLNVSLLQKIENGFNGIATESDGDQLETTREGCFYSPRIVVLKPKHQKAKISERCVSSFSSPDVSYSPERKCMDYPSPGGGKMHVEVKESKNLAYKMEPISLRSSVSRDILGKLTRKTRCNEADIESELMKPSYSDESYVAKEAKRQLSARQMMIEKFEVGMAGRGIILGNISKHAHETGRRRLDYKIVRHDSRGLDLSKFRTQQDKYVALCNEWSFKRKGSINLGQHKFRENKFSLNDGLGPINLRSNRRKIQSYPGLELKGIHTPEKSSGNFKNRQSRPRACLFAEKNDDSSGHVTETSVQQETPNELYKESPFLLHCSVTQPDCRLGFEEAYQPSPVSVLEPPFTEVRSPTPDCLGRMNVDITDYSDTYSEGSGIVSSDDDTKDDTNQGLDSSFRENEGLSRLFRGDESRDFSYLVDVLSEIGFYGRNSTMDEFDSSYHPELPVSLSVFESLEKKFGDQTSWKRSDRRLLFDRINAGLLEILEPCMGVPPWKKPVSGRIRSRAGQEMIEEDLWMFLVSQEKERRTDSAEKLLGSEIELDVQHDIDSVGREIERFLLDELVAEFVRLENF